MADLITSEDFSLFWDDNPLIILDSCSLLDLYRHAPSSSRRILGNLKEIQNDIWLPSHVVSEYYENKEQVIKDAHKKFENVSLEVQRIIKRAHSDINSKFNRYGKFRYPNIYKLRKDIENNVDTFYSLAESFKQVVASEIKDNKEALLGDEVNVLIETLKQNQQVGEQLSFNTLLKIYEEGSLRYNHLIPPGFKDIVKDQKDSTKLKKFGDLIIWKELLYKVKVEQRKIIFITDDEKEDWWEIDSTSKQNDKLIGPRKELISEFNEYYTSTDNGFIMLTLSEFNKHISLIKEENFFDAFLYDIEMNPEHIINKIIGSKQNWFKILDDKNKITHYLTQDDELEILIDENLLDFEIKDYSLPDFNELNVDCDEDCTTIIEGKFNSRLLVEARKQLSFPTDYEYKEFILFLSGNISVEFKYDYVHETKTFEPNSTSIEIPNINVENYNYLPTKEFFPEDMCDLCFEHLGVNVTYKSDLICEKCSKKYDICDGCGILYDLGSLTGKHCSHCNYFSNDIL